MKKGLKTCIQYVLVFYIFIVFWETVLYLAAHGSLSGMNGFFLLFALPQAMVPAAFCGWKGERAGRIAAAVVTLLISVFYLSQMLYLRVFGSMISMSMVGMGGDALENFGWALMETVKESVHWIVIVMLPVILMVIRIFIRKHQEEKLPFVFRPGLIAAAVLIWMLFGASLRLGGTSDSSPWYAYSSQYVDTDTSAQKLGVLTTSVLETKSILLGRENVDETDDLISAGISTDKISIPASASSGVAVSSGAAAASPEQPQDAAGIETEEMMLDTSPNIIDDIDFEQLAGMTESAAKKKLCNYFAASSGTNKNEYTGLLEGYNVIYICAEAFSNLAVNEEITPLLYKLSHEGIVFTNFYNSYPNTTTNGEFAFMTGLWPDVSRKADNGAMTGSFGKSVKNYMPYSLGNIFTTMDVKSFAYHNYLGTYYGRNKTHVNMGYKCKFMEKMKFTTSYPTSDLEMFKQTVDDYIGLDRFNVYYMTFSGHAPYKDGNPMCHRNIKSVPTKYDGRTLGEQARCYFAGQIELEKALQYLLDRLEEAGKLDNTLIVMAGDHYPYRLDDKSAKNILGYLPDENFEKYHSTCIMWSGGISDPIVCDVPCCNVDILPTVLNLLGIEYDSRMLSGTDVFSDSPHVAMLYNKNIITDSFKYNASSGKVTPIDTDEEVDMDELKTRAAAVYDIQKAKYAAAISIVKEDFYRFVWKNSGLLS